MCTFWIIKMWKCCILLILTVYKSNICATILQFGKYILDIIQTCTPTYCIYHHRSYCISHTLQFVSIHYDWEPQTNPFINLINGEIHFYCGTDVVDFRYANAEAAKKQSNPRLPHHNTSSRLLTLMFFFNVCSFNSVPTTLAHMNNFTSMASL